MLGLAFDPERPVAASSSFDAGGESIPAGAIFDWRARGMSQLDALALFSAGLLVHPVATTAPASSPPAAPHRDSKPAKQRARS